MLPKRVGRNEKLERINEVVDWKKLAKVVRMHRRPTTGEFGDYAVGQGRRYGQRLQPQEQVGRLRLRELGPTRTTGVSSPLPIRGRGRSEWLKGIRVRVLRRGAAHGICRTLRVWNRQMARKKVTVVGAGNVGATTAQRLFERGYMDVVLVDVVEDMPQGKALDMAQSGPVLGVDASITGTNGYEETADSDVVVITAGIARKPGMSRDDLLFTNMKIVGSVVQEVAPRSPNAVIIVISNPLDAMVQHAYSIASGMGFTKNRVVGMAGVLDTARFRTFLAQELDVSVKDVQAYVLGGHGDQMVPLTQYTTVGGVSISKLLDV